MIIAQMASFSGREESLEIAIKSLLPQVDAIKVSLNGIEPPGFLDDPKIQVKVIPKIYDIGDRGKVNWCEKGTIFLVDDDILYPNNYIRKMISVLEQHDYRAIVGVHAATMKPNWKVYYKDRHVRPFYRASLECSVDVLGTGTLAFHTDYFQIGIKDTVYNNVLDCHFAAKARKEEKKMICVARRRNWLSSIKRHENCIFDGRDDEIPTLILKEVL